MMPEEPSVIPFPPSKIPPALTQKQKYHRVLVAPQDGDTVHLELERCGDYWMITSKQLPGLMLCSKSLADTVAQFMPAMEVLWKAMQQTV